MRDLQTPSRTGAPLHPVRRNRRFPFLQLAAGLVLAICGARAAHAQGVRWENGDSSLGNMVQLVFSDCEPDGTPQLPPTTGGTLTYAGRSESVNMVNFSVSRSVTLSYFVQAQGGQGLKIPAFTVKTNKGPMKVAAFDSAAPAASAQSVASSKLMPAHPVVWAGQVFDLTYELQAARSENPQINPTFDWKPAPLITEDWSKPAVSDAVRDGRRQIVVTYRTRAYAKNPDTVKLAAATHLLQIQTGSASWGLFTQPRMEPVSVTSNRPVIEVRPLPTPPAGFSGAVGRFKLVSKVVPRHASVGDPVTWTLELSGTGNWPDIPGLPSREVSKDFQVVQPKPRRTLAKGKLFDATLSEDVVLIPTKTGTYTLDPVRFTYFDPQSGTYRTLTTEATEVTITPPPAPQFGGPAAAATGTAAGPTASTTESARPITAPPAPSGIPRDPLPGHANAAPPLSPAALAGWLVAPFVALLGFWLALAWRRAARTDPLRPRRQARTRLATLLAAMRDSGGQPSDPAMLRSRLLQWQHDAGILWGIAHAAPSATALEAAATASGTDANGAAEWAALWREADRALYAAGGNLPSDWTARAEAALESKRIPGFKPARLFLPHNLLPFAAAVAVALLVPGHVLHAAEESPRAAYRAGKFTAAENSWRETIARHPTDWIARHNLALALAQEGRSGEALAEAAAAFVQHPDNASVRWHFALLADKAGFAPAPLVPLLKEGPASDLATLVGPATWQRILIATAFVFAAALGWMVANAYRSRSRGQFRTAAVGAALAVLVGAVAGFGLKAYGMTLDRRAVIAWQGGTLRSIPTEADTSQQTTNLAAGSVAIVNRTFLDWDRLAFANGQTGWVRKEQVIPIWR